MSSRIEQLIDEIEEYIESCKPRFMSSTEIIVNKEEMDDFLRELRMKTPDEIKHYQQIVSQKEEILAEARARAEALIQQTTEQTTELINEHEIMQQAYAQANEVVTMASSQAQAILDNATMEANSVRSAAMQYMDDMLASLEGIIMESSQNTANNCNNLLGTLNHYLEIIQSNRRELYPPEEEIDDVLLNKPAGTDDTDSAAQ